jgi:hypothetical protein
MSDDERASVDVRLNVSGTTEKEVRDAIEATMKVLRAGAPPGVRVRHFRLRSEKQSPSFVPTMTSKTGRRR